MMKFMEKTKGAVSIFLVLIILPVMTIAGIFLDVSRTKLGQEVVSTSADLALNTVLSEYDKNLKDYYGLFGSCQDNTEIVKLAKQYFADAMVSAGVDTSAAMTYADNVMSAFVGDDDISDMLRMQAKDSVSIKKATNGSLDNPAILKQQIVEFMKYRAPVNGVADLFSKLVDSDVDAQVENASKEAKLAKAKREFYEAEEKLIEQAEEAYEATKEYQKYQTSTGYKISDEKFLDEMAKFLANPDGTKNSDGTPKGFEQVYREAHSKMVKNLYNTHESSGTYTVTLLKKKSITSQSKVTTYKESKQASADKIKTLLNDFNSKLVAYAKAKKALNSAWNKTGAKKSGDYSIQYWVILTNYCSESYSAYITATQNLWKSANKIENAVSFAQEGAMDTKIRKPTNANVVFETPDLAGELSMQSVYDTLSEYYAKLKSEVTGGGTASFKNINTQLSSLDTATNNSLLEVSNVENIFNIRNKANNFATDFENAEKLAKNAKEQTDDLKKKLKKYKEAFEDWKTAANDKELDDSKMAIGDKKEGVKGDRAEIKELEKTGIELFSQQSVTDMTDRLGNIETVCKTFKSDIKNIKYNGTSIINISDFAKFYNACKLDKSKIGRTESSLNSYAASTFSFSITKPIQRIEVHDGSAKGDFDQGDAYVITDSTHLNMEKTKLELFEWMKKKFDTPPSSAGVTKEKTGFDVSGKKEATRAKKSMKSSADDSSDDEKEENGKANTTGKDIEQYTGDWKGASLPSGKADPEEQDFVKKIDKVVEYVSDLFGDFSGTFKNTLVSGRDDLFMTEYVFDMFTFDTFDYEGCYAILDEKGQTDGLKSSNCKDKYKSVESEWTASNDNKTLTLTPRNASNNRAYGSEIEYLLYGNTTNSKNTKTAYTNVYLIRYALDVAPVFCAYYDDPILSALAAAIEAFAFIPAGVTKTLACLAITAAEAGVDLSYLKAGLPVILVKGKKDLVCNYKKVFMGESEQSVSDDGKITLQYSDYLKMFLFMKLVGDKENTTYARCADLIQANVSLVTDNHSFALSKSRAYYKLSAEVVMEPMWSKLLLVDNYQLENPNALFDATGWRTISVNMERGY